MIWIWIGLGVLALAVVSTVRWVERELVSLEKQRDRDHAATAAAMDRAEKLFEERVQEVERELRAQQAERVGSK